MGIKTYAQAAANWAVSMVGYEYSQAKRLQDSSSAEGIGHRIWQRWNSSEGPLSD